MFVRKYIRLMYNLIYRRMFTSKVLTDDSRLLQESNFSRKAATLRHITSYRQLRVKDLPKVPTWRLELESNQRHFAPKAATTTQPTTPLHWTNRVTVAEPVTCVMARQNYKHKERTEQEDVENIIRKRRLRCLGHAWRVDKDRRANKILHCVICVINGRKRRWRPRKN